MSTESRTTVVSPDDCDRIVARSTRGDRRGFTLTELLVTLTVVAVIGAVAMPSFQSDERLRLVAASSILMSDLEYAQVLNIAHPDTPVVVRFAADGESYWLAYAADPDVPIAREDNGDPYLVEFGVGRARTASGVLLSFTEIDDLTLEYDGQGALEDFTSMPVITLSFGSASVALSIEAQTGTVSATDEPAGGEEVKVLAK
jgi:prepilin-type N-terminal cleavage/methylation domain-containing protein